MGRPKGDRQRWSVALWVTDEQRKQVEEKAKANGESVAGMLLRLALKS